MKITSIGHASYLFETAAGNVLTDPVFFDPFEGGANTSYPIREVDLDHLPKIDCALVTHRHFDHFDVQTLAQLDRSIMVFHPPDDLIERALRSLGFERRRAIGPWTAARHRGLELTVTPSNVWWPELGMILRDGETTVWSLVDTVIDTSIVDRALASIRQ